MIEPLAPVLVRNEWVERPSEQRRLKFRRDGTGFYEREGQPGARLVHENFLYRVEGGTLHLKFAHAREWAPFAFDVKDGSAADSRFGKWEMSLERDPYAWILEEKMTGALELQSDAGAALAE